MRKTPETRQDTAYGRENDRIVIERRVTVAVITADDEGGEPEHPMLRAAFMAASDALADGLTDSHASDHVEFTYGGHRFHAFAEPTEPAAESTPI